MAEFSDMGGAAALLTGRWLGEAGMARPNRGAPAPCRRAPGMGGRSRGAGEAILDLSAVESSESSGATTGKYSKRLSKRCSEPS